MAARMNRIDETKKDLRINKKIEKERNDLCKEMKH